MNDREETVVPDASQLLDLEESMWRAESRFDRNWIAQYIHPEFIEFGCSGRVYQLSDLMAQIQTTVPTLIDCELPLPNFTLSKIDKNTVLVTYDSHVKYSDGMQFAHRMSLWLHNGEHWQMRSHQGTVFEIL